MKLYIQILSALLLLLFPTVSFGKTPYSVITYKREINLTFQVGNQAKLNLENRYGDIHFYRWDKNQIKATITINVKAGNDEEAKKIANGITIQKNQTGNQVSLQTIYQPSGSSSFWSLLFGGTSGGKKNVSINYKVYLPHTLGNLNVQNKYGDITGSHIPGTVNMDLSYGHFHLDNLEKPLNFQVKYGSGSLTDLSNAVIESSYTDFIIDRVHWLKMHYKYSDLTFGKVGSIILDGSYGDLSAESISELTSQTSYGDYKIQHLGRKAVINTAYGDVHIQQTDNLKQLNITARYSDVFLGISQNQPLRVNIRLHYGDFNSGGVPLQEVQKTEKGSITSFKGHSSNARTEATEITIDGSYSDVKFQIR